MDNLREQGFGARNSIKQHTIFETLELNTPGFFIL